MKRHGFSLLLCLILAGAAPGGLPGSEPGETALNFLKIPVGARAAGMGEAFVAVSDDASGFYYNPAGLSRLRYSELSCMGVKWPGGMDFGYVSAAAKFKKSAVSINYVTLSKSGIAGYDGTGAEAAATGFSDTMIALTYSFSRDVDRVKQKSLQAGASVKLIRENLDTESALAVAFDAGLIYTVRKDALDLGLSVQNAGTATKFYGTEYAMPLNLRAGTAFRPFGKDLLIAVDVNLPVDNYASLNAGCEYRLNEFFTLRAGWREKPAERDLDEGLRCGIGFEGERVNVDYAYAPYGFLGEAHRFGVNYRFGSSGGRDYISRTINRHFEKAVRLYGRRDYVGANRIFNGILSIDPGHTASAEYVKKIAGEIKNLRAGEYLEKGERDYNRNNFLEAKEAFENILLLLPEDAGAKGWIARLDEKINKEKQRTADLLFRDGYEYYARGQYAEAVQAWKKVLNLLPEHGEALKYTELAAEKIRELEKEKELETLAKNLREADLVYEKAEKHFEAKKYDRAQEAAQAALNLSPKHQKAAGLLKKAKEQAALIYYETAKKLFEAGKTREAAEPAKAAVEMNPASPAAKALLREIESRQAEANRARADELNKKALEKYSEAKLDEAIKLWEEALEACPQHENSRNNLTRAREELKGK